MSMNLANFLQDLRHGGIALSLDGDSLRVNAPKGAFTPSVREQLLQHKHAIVQWLKETLVDDGQPLRQFQPDPAAVFEPFPLADLQLGFYMADDPFMEFHVRPHYYIEKNWPGLDTARYEAAWQRALKRHAKEIVVVRADGLLQTVADPQPLPVTVYDLRELNPQDVAQRQAEIRAEMMRSELPLDRWPWLDLRVSLWRENGSEQARVHYNHNNFFSDGYGTTRLLQEVDRYYADPALELPPLELSFRDAAMALEQLAESDSGRSARQYWESRLPALPGPPALPQKANMERRCRSRLERREGFLSPPLWQAFKAHAQQAGLTPSNAIFAAYAEVLAAWSNSAHFVLSNMMTRRLNVHPQVRDIVGNFASLYPLEIDLRERASFADSARRIQEQVIADARHLQWGGMRVMQALGRQQGGMGRAPVPFVIGSGLFMEGFTRSDFSCLETSQVMLDHQFWELPDGQLYFVWDLLEAFFPDGVVDDMWQAYATMLRKLAHDEQAWQQTRFDLIPPSALTERGAVATNWEDLPSTCLDDFLPASAQLHPANAAIQTPDADFDYRTLHVAAAGIAARLKEAGLQRGERVAILADRGPALLAAVHGTLMAGGAYLPIDPDLPAERQHYLLANSEAHHLLAEPHHAQDKLWPHDVLIHSLGHVFDAAAPAEPTPVRSESPNASTDLAYLIYTSGSTGAPKGVMIDHRGAVNTVLDVNERYGVGPQDRLLGVSSFSFDLSVYDIFGAAAAGACLVYPEPAQALNPAHWLDLMETRAVTVWNSAPQLAALMAEAAELRGSRLPDLRLVMMSGDWIPVDLPERLRRIAPQAQIVSLGGATEASIWSIAYDIGEIDPSWPSIPYGYPMKNQSWAVLDDWGRPAPRWVAGDLYIGGVGLAQGYWADADKTRAAFVTCPQSGERRYRTGDVGRYLPGGLIEFLGRKDSQVKIQGHRIELGEIESQLCAHPMIAAAVVAVQKPASGGSAQLVAHVVAAPGTTADTQTLREHLARKLPDYMVPRLFNVLQRLPISPNGKVDRKALPLIDDALATSGTRPAYRAPASQLEEALLALWSKVLKQDDLGTADDFFDRGGQSFEAVRLVGLIRETLHVTLTLGDIWQLRTVTAVAAMVEGLQGTPSRATRSLVTLREVKGSAHPPLFMVHPAGGQVMCYSPLAALLDCSVHAFEAAGTDGSTPPRDTVAALAEAYLSELVARHPEGPVMLGGWSSGAPIAFDMAARLFEAGREVRGLLLIDSPAPGHYEPVGEAQLFDWFIEDLALNAPMAKDMEASRAAPPEERLAQLAQLMEHSEQHGAGSGNLVRAVYRVFCATVRATRSYQPRMVDVDVLLLRARDGRVSEFASHPNAASRCWGWSGATRGLLEVETLPGTHHTLLTPALVGRVAQVVSSWLDDRRSPGYSPAP